ncbi:MAG: hypothetical protein IPM35_10015 [Myxococcales bacterium]|nr:hypothetical protein [Myxococcales bacterium]
MRQLRLLAVPLVAAALNTACWGETQSFDRTSVSLRAREIPTGEPAVTVTLNRSEARATVAELRTCERIETREERTVVRYDKSPTWFGYVGPAALIALGLLTEAAPTGGGSKSQGAGLVVVAGGAGAYVVVAARSGERQEARRPVQKEVYAGRGQCERRRLADVQIEVRGEAGVLTGRSDSDGIAWLDGDPAVLDGRVRVFVDRQPVERVVRHAFADRPVRRPRPEPPPPPAETPRAPAAPTGDALPPPPPRPDAPP